MTLMLLAAVQNCVLQRAAALSLHDAAVIEIAMKRKVFNTSH